MTTIGGIAFLYISNFQNTIPSQIHKFFKLLNQSLKTFSQSFWGIPLRRFNLRHLTFGGRYISASKIFLETRDDKKCTGG